MTNREYKKYLNFAFELELKEGERVPSKKKMEKALAGRDMQADFARMSGELDEELYLTIRELVS